MGFKLGNKNILSRISGNKKSSGFKFSGDPGAKTTYEYRTNTSSSPRGQVVNVSGGSRKAADKKQYEKWGSQYLYGLENIGLLEDYKKSRVGAGSYKNMQERYKIAKEYYNNLTPEQQWQVQDYRYKTFYPNKYEEWQQLNPQVTTTVKERRGTTTTPGTSGGGYEDVWARMSDEQKTQHGGNFETWKKAAEEWNANLENQGTPGSVEQGDWEEISRNVRRH